MMRERTGISMGTAALITGLTLFLPAAPFAEFYVFKKLIIYNDGPKTFHNLFSHSKLFLSGIFSMFFMSVVDVVVAWCLYIFLKPVNSSVSLLAAWLRLLYNAMALAALFNFLHAYHLLNLPGMTETDKTDQVLLLVNARRSNMHFANILFGIYLIIVAFLIYKASYIPKISGVLMGLAGLAWVINGLQAYFFIGYNLSWLMFLSIGELVFVLWLLVRGRKIKES